jgi:hypothetical protein
MSAVYITNPWKITPPADYVFSTGYDHIIPPNSIPIAGYGSTMDDLDIYLSLLSYEYNSGQKLGVTLEDTGSGNIDDWDYDKETGQLVIHVGELNNGNSVQFRLTQEKSGLQHELRFYAEYSSLDTGDTYMEGRSYSFVDGETIRIKIASGGGGDPIYYDSAQGDLDDIFTFDTSSEPGYVLITPKVSTLGRSWTRLYQRIPGYNVSFALMADPAYMISNKIRTFKFSL